MSKTLNKIFEIYDVRVHQCGATDDMVKLEIREAIESVREPGDGYKEVWRYGYNAGINAALSSLGLLEETQS